MPDIYHLLLEARQQGRTAAPDDGTRTEASRHLVHLLGLAVEANLLQIQVCDTNNNFAVLRVDAMSIDEDTSALLLAGSKVIGHNDAMPTIACDHDACSSAPSRSFADAFGAAAYASNPDVANAISELRDRANALAKAGDHETAKALKDVARRLDIRPLSAK